MFSFDDAPTILRRYFSGLRHRRPDFQNNIPPPNIPSNFPPNTSPPIPGSPPQSLSTPAVAPDPYTAPNLQPTPSVLPSLASLSPNANNNAITFTTTYPVTTIFEDTSTFTSFTESVVLYTVPSPTTTALLAATASGSSLPSDEISFNNTIRFNEICVGHGLDAASSGVLATLVLSSVLGLTIWLVFAIVRPRFRQIYGLREWFVPPEVRPKPLGSGSLAFLSPPVPLIPDVPEDVNDAGRSANKDANLFPSDEQLSQRTLWVALRIVLGWSILALGGALPIYLVNMPCNSVLPDHAFFAGGYSTLQDLSLLRLLRLVDNQQIQTTNLRVLSRRALVGDENDPQNVRLRIIILTIIALVLGLFPALWKILNEFKVLAAYRRRWLQIKCQGKDLGWLSARDAPGFQNWGEQRFKKFIKKIGLTSGMDGDEQNDRSARRTNGSTALSQRPRASRRRDEELPLNGVDDSADVDIQSLFSISDTQHIALLIDQRDEILENLEIAETRYISSFQITTPDPSIADYEPPPPPDPTRPYISRPLPLGVAAPRRTRRRRAFNRAYGTTSLAPTSFVAPSSFYKLRGVNGLSGGRLTDSGTNPSFGESISSRVVGSRFLEVNRNSAAYGRLPLGGQVSMGRNGQLGAAGLETDTRRSWMSWIPDPRLHGPNWGVEPFRSEGISEEQEVEYIDEHGVKRRTIQTTSRVAESSRENETSSPSAGRWHEQTGTESHTLHNGYNEDEEWVDLEKENGIGNDFDSDFNGLPPHAAGPSTPGRRRPRKSEETVPTTRRETFPLRRDRDQEPDLVPPPHLRLQHAQPFVRPLDGLNFDDLGQVYEDITHWRSQLKDINTQIRDAQQHSYDDIAEGRNIRGWLIVGRGLRHIPGVQIIEGRAKEDIRWDVLQNERNLLDKSVLWTVVCIIAVLLGAGLTAVAGLAVSPAPDVTHYLSFLEPLLTANTLASGVATVFLPAVAATIFIALAIYYISVAANIHGSISRSGNQLFVFRIVFYVLATVVAIWLIAIGGILFALQAFDVNSGQTRSITNGAVYMAVLAFTIVINVAIIVPGLLLLQPTRLWSVLKLERLAVTPRQRFRAVYPRTYSPTFAISACVLAVMFASTFSLIFPLIAPAVVLLLLLSLVAHRFLVGYVYARTHSQTGGLLQLWLLKRFGTLLSFQPILLGLIFLSRTIWIEGGVLAGIGVVTVLFVEIYTAMRLRLPGRGSLSPITRDSLDHFASAADRYLVEGADATTNDSSSRGPLVRGSMASVLEMMSLTLAVEPSAPTYRGPVPLQTETLDDLTATDRAARTHPDAPPHLPPLPFTDHAEDMAGILYAPELIAPPPIIWLPRDSAEVAQSEAEDLKKYHNLDCTVDVRTREDVMLRRSSSRGRHAR
ncbi:hypothetical protein D9756_005814 [Leucocoprinus leucothites]|uniref:CSC1/OSCA1-like 7TM region domain-containing protein n=1 Tax=Leucocoprinus leucothites TaxID=201217 RepID=A0A8H5D3W4_9AGAR|nr:hypothetical protein D9756_005814 [Leucoagaricus leucothites]